MIDIGPATPTLTTERLALRELRMEDAHAVAMRAGDKRVARFLIAVPSPYPVALAARWITARIAWWPQGRGLTLAITHRATPHELIGTVSLLGGVPTDGGVNLYDSRTASCAAGAPCIWMPCGGAWL